VRELNPKQEVTQALPIEEARGVLRRHLGAELLPLVPEERVEALAQVIAIARDMGWETIVAPLVKRIEEEVAASAPLTPTEIGMLLSHFLRRLNRYETAYDIETRLDGADWRTLHDVTMAASFWFHYVAQLDEDSEDAQAFLAILDKLVDPTEETMLEALRIAEEHRWPHAQRIRRRYEAAKAKAPGAGDGVTRATEWQSNP